MIAIIVVFIVDDAACLLLDGGMVSWGRDFILVSICIVQVR